MRYIYITDCKRALTEEPEDVMIFPYGDAFAVLTPDIVKDLLTLRGWSFTECYWVESDQAQYYLYAPCWLKEAEEREWLRIRDELKSTKGE